MFWGCGVTSEVVAVEANIPFMIAHRGGCMLILDCLSEERVKSFKQVTKLQVVASYKRKSWDMPR
jgi:hypothetical protein